jgi:hydroxymethylbilane synthase
LAKDTLSIGTRGSALALRQAEWVKIQLMERYPQFNFKLVKIKTTGDKIRDLPLAQVGGKGLFVKEIEEALIKNKINLAVHSLKDVPTFLPHELMLSAISKRENPLDALISREGIRLEELPVHARLGTSSVRRQAQLLNLRPDFKIETLRGNLDTRIKKLETEKLDGIIIAAAGVIRMGWEGKITQYLDSTKFLPAIGQGALGIETRRDDRITNEIVAFLHHPDTAQCVCAERSFLKRLEGGCQVPIAAFGKTANEKLFLDGLISSLDGKKIIRDTIKGDSEEAEKIGLLLAEKILHTGGKALLEEIYRTTG